MVMNRFQAYRWTVKVILLVAVAGLTGCGGSDSKEPAKAKVTVPIDTSPEAFSFGPTTKQPLTTLITANAVTVSGINTATPISISGGEYSVDGGDFSSEPSTVTDQQVVLVRLLSSASYLTASEVTVTIGDISGTFSATTHSKLTRFAHELSTDVDARYAVVDQPTRGRVVVSPDLKQLTYHAMQSFDYLQEGESAQETIQVTLLGDEENKTHALSFTITGPSNTSVCEGRTIIDLLPSEVNQPLTHIPEGNCVAVDAANVNDGHWVLWTGESGAARPIMLPLIGVDATNPTLTFLPPTQGRYSLSWCPVSAECLVSFYFYSDMPDTKKALAVALNVLSFHPEDEIYLSVSEKNHADTTGYTYRWIIHNWTGEYHKLVDILTTENKLKLPISMANNNYSIDVIVDDNIIQLEGGFNSGQIGLYGKIEISAQTIGNYEKLSDYVVIRDPDSNKKPPRLVVMLEGDATRYLGNEDKSFPIDAITGSQLTFDMSETTDENGDSLSYYINGVLHNNASSRFTFDVTSHGDYQICASDGFPWSHAENPCVHFDLTAE